MNSPRNIFFLPPKKFPAFFSFFQDLKSQGLVRSLGVSNFTISHLEEILDDSDVKPSINQIEMHPYLSQKELVNYCRDNKIEITAYSPLGTGVPMEKSDRQVLLEDKVVGEEFGWVLKK
jgi:diketogulonate reductase-like aldo/keto reductase